MMKLVDSSIELVVCGSSNRWMKTFGTWELEVLDHTFEHVDYISIHTYLGNWSKDTASFLAEPEKMNDFICETVSLCDAVAAKRRSLKRMKLSFDEWNVWYHQEFDQNKEPGWPEAPPLLEDVYTVEDALVVGGILITLLNHADRVRIACLAQLVNVIAPIMTARGGPAWRQTIFYPFAQASAFGRGIVLRPVIRCPVYDCKEREDVPVLSAACVHNPDSGNIVMFVLNRSLKKSTILNVDLRAFPRLKVAEWSVLTDRNLNATNTLSNPDEVKPKQATGASFREGRIELPLRPASWNVIRFAMSAKDKNHMI